MVEVDIPDDYLEKISKSHVEMGRDIREIIDEIESNTSLEYIDHGQTRVVFTYPENPDIIIKFAYQKRPVDGTNQIAGEQVWWDACTKIHPDELEECFVPVVKSSNEHLWLIMEKAQPPGFDYDDISRWLGSDGNNTKTNARSDDPHADYEGLMNVITRNDVRVSDAAPSETGYHNGKLKFFDYGRGVSVKDDKRADENRKKWKSTLRDLFRSYRARIFG